MCGIFCEICYSSRTPTKDIAVLNRIAKRGPNCSQSLEINLSPGITGFFCGAVLWMQGAQLFPQPVVSEQGVLLYNGDIFDDRWDYNISDTQVIMQKLQYDSAASAECHITEQLKLFKGPFALVYYDKLNKNLYFMRDRIGRSSLLFYSNENSLIISNVLGRDYNCVEIPATAIQILNIPTKKIKLCSWNDDITEETFLENWLMTLTKQQSLPDDKFEFKYKEDYLSNEDGVIQYIESVAKQTKTNLCLLKKILESDAIKLHVNNVTRLLEKSMELRLKRQPNKCKECISIDTDCCDHCTVGVLFSGGLDCTLLALLADKYLPNEHSIDLINVAFKKDSNTSYDVPDRLTGRQSLLELKKICPTRKWTFIEVDVPNEEVMKYQENTIGDLVYPRQTILDESLGTALWFAARAEDSSNVSSSRVLLIGAGADELFGGYIRHRNAYKRNGWHGLSKELQLDWQRISFRNLARDNRVICDHGRQPRMPYLDEDFTNYVLQLKPWLRCFPSEDLNIGVGDKLMLRLVAINMGLIEAAILPKRALQFGSRIANKKEKGSDISKTFIKNKIIST